MQATTVLLLLLVSGVALASNPLNTAFSFPPNDFDPTKTYYFGAELMPQYAYPLNGGTDTNAGYMYGTLTNGVFSYKLVHSVAQFSSQGIFGPRLPLTDPTNQFSIANVDESNPISYNVVGNQIVQLPNVAGAVVGTWTPDLQGFMQLWAGALYVQVNTAARPNGTLAGNIQQMNYGPGQAIFALNMEGNDGSRYPPLVTPFPSSTGTSNTGIGYLMQTDISTNVNTWFLRLYHTASNPGNLIIYCPNLAVNNTFSITKTATSPIRTGATTLPDALAQEMFVPGACYIFFTSNQYPNGELFSHFVNVAPYAAQLTGANMAPAVSSSYYASGFFYLDRPSQTLVGGIKTNLTASLVTSIDMYVGTTGATSQGYVCNLFTQAATGTPVYPSRLACRFNGTASFASLWNGGNYIVVSTTANTGGELRAQVAGSSVVSSAALSAGAIAGIVIGVVAAVAIVGAVVGVVLFKKSGKSCTGSSGKL